MDLPYDLLIQGGHVIDPGNHLSQKMDLAVAGNRIARVAPEIDTREIKNYNSC